MSQVHNKFKQKINENTNKNKKYKPKNKRHKINKKINFNWRHLLTLFNEREIKSETKTEKIN